MDVLLPRGKYVRSVCPSGNKPDVLVAGPGQSVSVSHQGGGWGVRWRDARPPDHDGHRFLRTGGHEMPHWRASFLPMVAQLARSLAADAAVSDYADADVRENFARA